MGTHFSSGVTNVFKSDQMGALRTMDPSQYYSYTNDFFNYTAADWVVTETDSGSTEAIVDGAGGLLAITNVSAGATDAAQIQYAGGSGAGRLTEFWDPTKDFIMKTRVMAEDATNTAWLIGAATVDTTVVASLPTNGIYFYKASGATSVIASTRKAGTSSSATLGATADATFAELAFTYTASDGIWRGWFNNTNTGNVTVTTNSPTAGLCISIGLLNASAAAHVLTVDYLNIFAQR